METEHILQVLQDILLKTRGAKKISQQQLAIRSDLTREYISLLECRERMPRLDTLIKLCDGLGISFAEFSVSFEKSLRSRGQVARLAADSRSVRWNIRGGRRRKK